MWKKQKTGFVGSVSFARYWNFFNQKIHFNIFNNGSLGSRNDEERGKKRYLIWIAKPSESSSFWTQIALLTSSEGKSILISGFFYNISEIAFSRCFCWVTINFKAYALIDLDCSVEDRKRCRQRARTRVCVCVVLPPHELLRTWIQFHSLFVTCAGKA